MDYNRWNQMQRLFHDAAARPEAARAAFLEQACGGDRALEAEVRALLEEDLRSDTLLDRDMAEVAANLLQPPATTLPFLMRLPPKRGPKPAPEELAAH